MDLCPPVNFYDFPACYYRFHLEAPVRFSSSIRCGIEHGGVNDTDSTYASLAYYYVRERRGLAQTDAVVFSGDRVEALTGQFDGDDDDVDVTCAILSTEAPVEHVLRVDPANAGVRLRRVLDQAVGPQRADVAVDGAAAGTWYDPDRNPFKSLGESDLELPPALVRGKSSIRIKFTPQGGKWSLGELRALSYVERPLQEPKGKLESVANRASDAPRKIELKRPPEALGFIRSPLALHPDGSRISFLKRASHAAGLYRHDRTERLLRWKDAGPPKSDPGILEAASFLRGDNLGSRPR